MKDKMWTETGRAQLGVNGHVGNPWDGEGSGNRAGGGAEGNWPERPTGAEGHPQSIQSRLEEALEGQRVPSKLS